MRDDVGLKKRLDSSIVLWNRRFKTGELPSFLSLPKMGRMGILQVNFVITIYPFIPSLRHACRV